MKYELAKGHTISTMVNLGHRYIHETDKKLLDKIAAGKSVMEEDFTWDDRKGEICFGLNEAYKPPTLCSPRPRILHPLARFHNRFYPLFAASSLKSVVFEFDYSSAVTIQPF